MRERTPNFAAQHWVMFGPIVAIGLSFGIPLK